MVSTAAYAYYKINMSMTVSQYAENRFNAKMLVICKFNQYSATYVYYYCIIATNNKSNANLLYNKLISIVKEKKTQRT